MPNIPLELALVIRLRAKEVAIVLPLAKVCFLFENFLNIRGRYSLLI